MPIKQVAAGFSLRFRTQKGAATLQIPSYHKIESMLNYTRH